jgi:hypothetical protein
MKTVSDENPRSREIVSMCFITFSENRIDRCGMRHFLPSMY